LSVGFSALLLLLFASAVIAETDTGSGSTNAFSLEANVADNSLELFGYCNSLEKDEAFECFRDMAATVSEKVKDIAILVSTITSLEIGCTDQQSDGACLQDPFPKLPCPLIVTLSPFLTPRF
jgi:hypothetical protein